MARKCEPVLPREFLPLISSLRTLRSRRQRYIASSASTALTKAGWISPREASKKPTPSSLLKCCFWTRCPPLAPPLPRCTLCPAASPSSICIPSPCGVRARRRHLGVDDQDFGLSRSRQARFSRGNRRVWLDAFDTFRSRPLLLCLWLLARASSR